MTKNPIKIIDIAKLAKVSTGTIDRVLHSRSGVSNKTRGNVLRIIEELGYKTNIIAKTLASKTPIVFSTLIPNDDKYSSYWKKPLIGINKARDEFATYGVEIKHYFFEINNPKTFQEQANLILKEQPRAVVIAPIFKKEALIFTKQLTKIGISYIFLDSNLDQEKNSLGFVGHNSNQSGKVAAKLIETRIENKDNILLVNLSENSIDQNHLLERSNGFRSFFAKKNRSGAIIETDINNLNDTFIREKLSYVFKNIPQIKAVFVPSSRVYLIAKYIDECQKKNDVIIVGYDLINENINYLKNNTIDYLISQNPIDQGFSSIEKIFKSVVLKQKIEKTTYFSIDIIIKENLMIS